MNLVGVKAAIWVRDIFGGLDLTYHRASRPCIAVLIENSDDAMIPFVSDGTCDVP